MLSREKRKRVSARAAKLLGRKTVKWREGKWIYDPLTGNSYDPIGETVGHARRWFRDHGLSSHNKECHVCLQGALLLALVEDTSVPDTDRVDVLLNEFDDDICGIDWEELGMPPELDDYSNAVDLNDEGLSYLEASQREETAIKILDAASK